MDIWYKLLLENNIFGSNLNLEIITLCELTGLYINQMKINWKHTKYLQVQAIAHWVSNRTVQTAGAVFCNSNSKVASELLMHLWFNTSDSIIYSKIEFPFLGETAGSINCSLESVFVGCLCIIILKMRGSAKWDFLFAEESLALMTEVPAGPTLLTKTELHMCRHSIYSRQCSSFVSYRYYS